MLRLIQCEFLKLKRKRLFQAAFLTTFIMPVLYSLLLSDSSFDDLMSVIREENGFLLLIPLTVVLAANLFFEEHDYDTLKNLMCVPVTKGRLTMAKLFVLLIFDIAYEAAGYMIAVAMSVISGIRLEDARYIDLYSDYTRLLDQGEKVSYVVAVLSEKYSVSERKVYALVKRFQSDCKTLAV